MKTVLRAVSCSFLALAATSASAQTSANVVDIDDRGDNNRARVSNDLAGNVDNRVDIAFVGNSNDATVDQQGSENNVDLSHQGSLNRHLSRQIGYRNSVKLQQIGDENYSYVDQYLDPRIAVVGDRSVEVTQHGTANSSLVTQIHWDNEATVIQGLDGAQSVGASSTILQYSAGNVANVTMTGGGKDASNRSIIEQTRIDPIVTNNHADAVINGSENFSYLYQSGAEQRASHRQSGTQNTIVSRSTGNLHTNNVSQSGLRNSSNVIQVAGNGNTSNIMQNVGDSIVVLVQAGSNNNSSVLQNFGGNSAAVYQNGNFGVSSIGQDGAGNTARVAMTGLSDSSANSSVIVQNRVDGPNLNNSAEVFLFGSGNVSNIAQVGSNHVATVSLRGGGVPQGPDFRMQGNIASVYQRGQQGGHRAAIEAREAVGSYTRINQDGEDPVRMNDASVYHFGRYDQVTINQWVRFPGDRGATADVAVMGENGFIEINQFGNNQAFVTQGLGFENQLNITSYDSGGSPRNGVYRPNNEPFEGLNVVSASQYGNQNSASVWQEGARNRANLWQRSGAFGNSANINQGMQVADPGGINCWPRCQRTFDSLATIDQDGGFNNASITQYGARVGAITQHGESAIASIRQYGGAEAIIFQSMTTGISSQFAPASGRSTDQYYFAGGARPTQASIHQRAGAISARIEQHGRGQFALIEQTGANTASIWQGADATNATAVIIQTGSGNSYRIEQSVAGQYEHVTQSGTNNSVTTVVKRP